MRLLSCAVFLAVLGLSGGSLAADTSPPDVRLDRKVTYQAKSELLHKVCEELSQKTGVTLRCGTSPNNWQVRDRKVTIIVHEMPLRDLQSSLASLLHFTWTRFEGKSGTYYRLVQTVKQKKEEQELLSGSPLGSPKRHQGMVKSAVNQIESIPKLSPEEITKLRTENPWLYALAKHPIGRASADLFNALPEIRQALLDHEQARISIDEQSPVALAAIRKFVETSDDFVRRVEPFDADIKREITLGGRYIEVNRLPMDVPLEASVLGVVSIDSGPVGMLPIYDPKSAVAKTAGRIYADILDGKPALQAYGPDGGDKVLFEELMETGETGDLPKDDPDLDKKIRLVRSGNSYWPEFIPILEGIAEQANVDIIADHFEPSPRIAGIDREGKLGPMLISLSLVSGKTVAKHGRMITFSEREWATKRSWEVPQKLLNRLHQRVEDRALDLEDAAALATLTDDQIEHTIRPDNLLVDVSWQIGEQSQKNIALLYGSLSPDQRGQLISDGGLNIGSLTPNQSALLRAASGDYQAASTLAASGNAKLSLDAKEETGYYEFQLIGPDTRTDRENGNTPPTWTFQFPRKAKTNS